MKILLKLKAVFGACLMLLQFPFIAQNVTSSHILSLDGICSIGSGAVESGIKQIGRRIKISGASWKSEHVGQVLAHRCAYLNGLIGNQVKPA
jgi:hypothetical protein